MKKIIRFTRIRFLAISISLTLIVIGIAFYVINNGFNMGIDFAGGLVMQVQIAPQAMTITNNSQHDIQVEVAKGGLLEAESKIRVTDAETKIHDIDLNKIATLQDLARELNALTDITATVTADANLSPEFLISIKKTVPALKSLVLNRQLLNGEPIFAPIEDVRALLAPIPNMNLQVVGQPEQQQYIMRSSVSAQSGRAAGDENTEGDVYQEQTKKIEDLFRAKYGTEQVIIIQSETMGVQLAQVLAMNSIGFVFIALVFMFIYITFRFHFTFAVGAILALVHDVLIMLGFISITGIEFNTITIAAILTIVGYSINDTIVVYDRIRENTGLLKDKELAEIMDMSITQTLSRTIMTAFTTFLAIIPFAILLTGTSNVKDFAVLMAVGIVEGTYSSIFIAAPLVLSWERAISKGKKKHEQDLFKKQPLLAPPIQPVAVKAALPESDSEEPEAEPVAVKTHEHTPIVRIQRTVSKKKKKKKKR